MKKRTVGVLLAAFFAMALTGCGDKQPQPGEVKGYDKGEEYLSIWVHSIEDTEEGQCYRKSVEYSGICRERNYPAACKINRRRKERVSGFHYSAGNV